MTSLYNLFLTHPLISTDTRRIEADCLFFALRGANFDGNRFAAEALEKGAACVVVDDKALARRLGSRAVAVEDTLTALQELALLHRRTLAVPILALTGSNGKTTTKELIRCVMSEKYEVAATQGNLNNHIGVPLTLLGMGTGTEFGIVEMGASARGEIARLAAIAEPNYGLITNIGRAHLEGFGGPEGVRAGKGELLDYLAANGGYAFIPQQDSVLVEMAAQRQRLAVEPYSQALADGIEHRLEGEYNLRNIAAAIAVGRYFGVDDQRIFHAIADYRPDNNRSQRIPTERNTVIADCYNANPSSMRVAIENLQAEDPAPMSRKVMILGDMLELGAWSAIEHADILRLASADPQTELLLVGEHFAAACSNAPRPNVELFPDCRALCEALTQRRISDALILLKASRGIGLERCIPLL